MAALASPPFSEKPHIDKAKRLVVKVGSALLVDRQHGLRQEWLAGLAQDVAAARAQGTDVVLVSSGSIALGRMVLGLPTHIPLTLEQSQAAAAVGQIRLARAYEAVLADLDIKTAQILITLADTEERRRYLNARATLETLLSLGVVPIVNENDTVATDEIRFGDNDRLAAQIAVTIGADQLILLSDVDGFYTANPKVDAGAKRLDIIDDITPQIEAMAGGPVSGLSKGGMKTKLMAARTAVLGGCALAIMEGSRQRPLQALSKGTAPCTWFLAKSDPQQARKRWINAMKPKGKLYLDAGAVTALRRGKSLLPAGVTQVDGTFRRGDLVEIADPGGETFGRGLVHYSSTEARALVGHKTGEITAILGYEGRAALVHRDDMVL